MLKRIVTLVFSMLFMVSMLPAYAFGSTVTLNLSTDSAIVGDSITASGTADADTWVSIKVIDSKGNIVFFDAVKADVNCKYSNIFKVPSVANGTLTVVAGYGNNVANETLYIKSPSSGGGGGGGSTVTPDEVITVEHGKEAVVKIPADALTGIDKSSIKIVKVTTPPPAPAGARLASDVFEFSIGDKSTYKFTKNVTLNLNFNAANIGPGEVPAVHYYNEAAQKWVNIGGTVSGNTITVEVNHFAKFAVMYVKPVVKLIDISGNWAEASIEQLVTMGAISGYPDDTFKPNNHITRAEFAKVLVKAYKLPLVPGKVFNDTTEHWAKEYIATAYDAGIVSGYSDTLFGPDDYITREQMAVMIVNAAKLTGITDSKTFVDHDQISSWAQDAIASATSNNIITGYPDNSFKPKGNATRAEAVTVIVKAL